MPFIPGAGYVSGGNVPIGLTDISSSSTPGVIREVFSDGSTQNSTVVFDPNTPITCSTLTASSSISGDSGAFTNDVSVGGNLGSTGTPVGVVYAGAVYTDGVASSASTLQLYGPTGIDIQSHTKLSAETAGRAMIVDGSNNLTTSATTSAELGYLSGTTSAIQTQIDSKFDKSGGSTTGAVSVGGTFAATATTGSSVFLNGSNGHKCLEIIHASDRVNTRSNTLDDGSGNMTVSGTLNGISPTTLGYLDATSSIQTQLNSISGGVSGALPLSGGTMTGAIVPTSAGTLDFGSISKPWASLFAEAVYAPSGYDLALQSQSGNIVYFKIAGTNTLAVDGTGLYPFTSASATLGKSGAVYSSVFANALTAAASTDLQMNAGSANQIALRINSSPVVNVSASGVIPGTDNTYELGSSSKAWGYLYANTIGSTGSNDLWLNSPAGHVHVFSVSGSGNYQMSTSGFFPYNDNARSLGLATTNRWNNIYTVNAPTVGSDRNIKTDIADSDLGLAFVNALRPVSYKMIPALSNSGRTHYGLIAQEVEDVLTGLGKTSQQFAGLCKDKDDHGVDHYSLRYEQFIAALIKANQELSTLVSNLRADVETLKAQVAAIQGTA